MSIPDSKAKKEWIKANTQMLGIKLNKNTDKDIIQKLDTIKNKQGYIKEVIRKDINKSE